MIHLELPVLLVERRDGESAAELLQFLQARYSARPDKQPGPVYTIGATYFYRGQPFSAVGSCAGDLLVRMVFESCGRSIIARFDPGLPLKLLRPDGQTAQIEENELAEEKMGDVD
jgi:hypothetical protein